MSERSRYLIAKPLVTKSFINQLTNVYLPIENPKHFEPLLESIDNAPYVLLGEASHGTSEYYRIRTILSKTLIEENGFSFIAVEGDWPDCFLVNSYVKGKLNSAHSARDVLKTFKRWPTWMWANEEIIELIEWLKEYNSTLSEDKKAGFYGLDIYSLWESLHLLALALKKQGSEAIKIINQILKCFEPFGENSIKYAQETVRLSFSCEHIIEELIENIKEKHHFYTYDERENQISTEQNARVLKNAEAYYRTMIKGGVESWNIRDHHMIDTLDRLMNYHGPNSKCIVWAHNTHIGDARYTDMKENGEINVGQLTRQRHGEKNVFAVGFASHQGSVIASNQWDGPVQVMPLSLSRVGSWENVLHGVSAKNKLLLFKEASIDKTLFETRGHRAVGVIYHPEYEHLGNYVPTVMPKRYDALIYVDQTSALHPLPIRAQREPDIFDTFHSAV